MACVTYLVHVPSTNQQVAQNKNPKIHENKNKKMKFSFCILPASMSFVCRPSDSAKSGRRVSAALPQVQSVLDALDRAVRTRRHGSQLRDSVYIVCPRVSAVSSFFGWPHFYLFLMVAIVLIGGISSFTWVVTTSVCICAASLSNITVSQYLFGSDCLLVRSILLAGTRLARRISFFEFAD
jgi:hypothetical protein